jgi:hypothetical protein
VRRSPSVRRSPKELLAASAALLRGHEYQLRGVYVQGEQSIRVQMRVHSRRSLDVTLASEGATLEIRFTSGHYYFRANARYWIAVGGSSTARLAGDWFAVPAARGRTALGGLAPASFARCLTENAGNLSFAGRTTVGGHRAVVVREDGNTPGGQAGTLAIASTGKPWPLRIVATGQQRPGGRVDVCNSGKGDAADAVVTLSHFDAVGPIASPLAPVRLPSGG